MMIDASVSRPLAPAISPAASATGMLSLGCPPNSPPAIEGT
jgi:hypothetical protein